MIMAQLVFGVKSEKKMFITDGDGLSGTSRKIRLSHVYAQQQLMSMNQTATNPPIIAV